MTVRTLSQLFDTIEWRRDLPPNSGYYLIAWVNKSIIDNLAVSEAWFNPDSIMHWWWSRGYTGEPKRGINAAIQHDVIAWAVMPSPPKVIK